MEPEELAYRRAQSRRRTLYLIGSAVILAAFVVLHVVGILPPG
jgi:hypothetical protein